MRDILNSFGAGRWWVGAIVVGVVAGILASYARSFLDRALASWRARRLARSAERRAHHAAIVQALRGDTHALIAYASRLHAVRVSALGLWVGFFGALLLARFALSQAEGFLWLALAVASLFGFFRTNLFALSRQEILDEASDLFQPGHSDETKAD